MRQRLPRRLHRDGYSGPERAQEDVLRLGHGARVAAFARTGSGRAVRRACRRRETLAVHERILLARARTNMDTFVASLGTGLQVETLVTTGSPADEIGAIAAEHNVGLIVMGLVGTSGLLGVRPGSVAYRVLCLATAPVLALPPSPDAST